MLSLEDIHYCAEECERQQSGELSVYFMVEALTYARHHLGDKLFWDDVLRLGAYVEPNKNEFGFRKIPVEILGKVIPAVRIQERIAALCEATHLIAEEFYKEFEEIHPFVDGNGRVGSILYNWLNGTLDNPVAPPDVFK